jgi:molybdopterin molybdotransferase
MTGAAIPDGADAVVMQEYTESQPNRVVVLRSVDVGENIRRAGADVRPGTQVAAPGVILGPAHVGMLTSIGRTTISVTARPRVAILATGDELVEPDRLTDDGRIASSNSYVLHAALQDLGAVPVYLGITTDDLEATKHSFRRALNCDVIISTGGVSVGERDWVRRVLSELGGSIRLWRVRMKPGSPLVFATLQGRLVFGLPGNPVSTLVTFEQFVRPALLRMMRRQEVFRPVEPAILAEDYEKTADRMHFVRVMLQERDGCRFAFPTGDQSSGVLLSMVRADGLAIIAADVTRVSAGTEVQVFMLHRDDLCLDPGF